MLVLLVVFVLTFLGAKIFNILNGEPFNAAQVLWIHFVVNAPFGFALGFDRETPGLMRRKPRPGGQTVLTTGNLVTTGLAGLALTIGLLSLLEIGKSHFDSAKIGQSMAFLAFSFCLIVAALECRNLTQSCLRAETFDGKQMNRTVIGQFALAVLSTQLDGFNRILGTTSLNLRQFEWALLPPVALLGLWELGKLVARRHRSSPADEAATSTPAGISPHGS